jgi:fermentation-respiration switch protein FrsA (DUF1100 family)
MFLRPLLFLLLFFTTGCSGLFYHPDRNLYYPPHRMGFSAQEYVFSASDGTQLDGWFFTARKDDPAFGVEYPPRRAQGTIIQFHGNSENMSSHYLSLVWLIDHGFNVFTFDYRGFGKSQGEPNQKGTYEDALAALDLGWKLHQLSGAEPRFIVYSQSLGGVIAMRSITDFKHRDEVSLLVLDSTFVSYQQIAREKMASHWFTWPLQPLTYLLVSDGYGAENSLHRNSLPLLVIHDKKDPVVPFDLGQKNFDEDGAAISHKGPRDFWILNAGRHVGVFVEPAYRDRFVRTARAARAEAMPVRWGQ